MGANRASHPGCDARCLPAAMRFRYRSRKNAGRTLGRVQHRAPISAALVCGRVSMTTSRVSVIAPRTPPTCGSRSAVRAGPDHRSGRPRTTLSELVSGFSAKEGKESPLSGTRKCRIFDGRLLVSADRPSSSRPCASIRCGDLPIDLRHNLRSKPTFGSPVPHARSRHGRVSDHPYRLDSLEDSHVQQNWARTFHRCSPTRIATFGVTVGYWH